MNTSERNRLILQWLVHYQALTHRNCDETDWICLKLSCTRRKAEKWIAEARASATPPRGAE